jgi:hypothetical protein
MKDQAAAAAAAELRRLTVAILPLGELRRLAFQYLPGVLAPGSRNHPLGDEYAIAVVVGGNPRGMERVTRTQQAQRERG